MNEKTHIRLLQMVIDSMSIEYNIKDSEIKVFLLKAQSKLNKERESIV